MENFRKIRISKRHVRTTWNAKNVPSIRMQGEYLKIAGFRIGYECSVIIEQGKITITTL